MDRIGSKFKLLHDTQVQTSGQIECTRFYSQYWFQVGFNFRFIKQALIYYDYLKQN